MKCTKCNDTGLIPHPTIKNAWLDCDCKQLEPEHYQPIKIEDIDFPCSELWRRYYDETINGNYSSTQVIAQEPETELEMPVKLSEILKDMNINIKGLMRRSHIHEPFKKATKEEKL